MAISNQHYRLLIATAICLLVILLYTMSRSVENSTMSSWRILRIYVHLYPRLFRTMKSDIYIYTQFVNIYKLKYLYSMYIYIYIYSIYIYTQYIFIWLIYKYIHIQYSIILHIQYIYIYILYMYIYMYIDMKYHEIPF